MKSELILSSRHLFTLYQRLFQTYGPQFWWPADSAFEVMIGAILTQNTAWTNVEKALANLQQADCLNETALIKISEVELAQWIRPSGYFNIKAKRLKNFIQAYQAAGGFKTLSALPTQELRSWLLAINGIGPETADDILLYAFERPVFVIDVYTRRLFGELGLISGKEGYEDLRAAVETALNGDAPLYNEYHALIVRHAKEKCTLKTACPHCSITAPWPE